MDFKVCRFRGFLHPDLVSFRNLIFDVKVLGTPLIFVYLIGTFAFLVFDIGLTRLIGFIFTGFREIPGEITKQQVIYD